MTILISWLLYACALFFLCAALGLLVVERKAFGLIDGHLGIGFGVALMFASLGFLAANLNRLEPLALAIFIPGFGIGFALWFFGRRRAVVVNRYHRAIREARAKQASLNAD